VGADELHVTFDTDVYSLTTIQKAALKFTNAFSFQFEMTDAKVSVRIQSLSDAFTATDSTIERALHNEVLDQHLRAIVARETETERNLILAYAFSNTKLIDS
jgi:His-Xaa-Ser system protein HxsD